MARQAILPRNAADPTGQDARERKAIADFKSRMLDIQRGTLRILDSIPVQAVTINSAILSVNETVYRFDLDENVLARMNQELELLIQSILLEGGERSLWFMQAYVQPAYQQGTAQSVANLTVQSAEYALARPTLESVILSDPYRRRLSLVRARQFENMKGFALGSVKRDLANTLMQGMAQGLNPRDIAKNIRKTIDISESRARTIARTEITNALRQARMDEDDSAGENLGIRTKQMHLSAFSPTTREDHAKRSGNLYTTEEQREWWSFSKNVVNCKCTTIAVLVDDEGKPLTPSIVERAKRIKAEKLRS